MQGFVTQPITQAVSTVDLDAASTQTSAELDGQPAVYLSVFPTPKGNPLIIVDGIKKLLPTIRQNLPPGVDAVINYERARFIQASIDEVMKTLLEAVLIVVLVIWLCLESLCSVVIAVVAIPLSMLGAAALMFAFGMSINLLTLLALVLAIGLVVVEDSDLDYNSPVLEVRIDRSKAASLGIPLQAIGDSLGARLDESYINRFTLFGRSYDVIAQATREQRLTPQALTRQFVRSAQGALVPLSSLITLHMAVEPNHLNQFNQQNSAILMVAFANAVQVEEQLDRRAAIIRAAQIRLRPVLMTTGAMSFGVLPLLFASGAGAASRFGLGLVLTCGMLVGTCFTLFILPTVYTFLARDHRIPDARHAALALVDQGQ